MLFYRRIFRLGTRSGVSMAIWVVIALVIIWAVGFTIPSIFLCGKNVSYLWGTLADQMRCADTVSEQLALTISDMLLDLIVFSFPIPLVRVLVPLVFALDTDVLLGLASANEK